MKTVEFESEVELTDSTPPWHIVRVPRARVIGFGFKGNLRRVVCSLNGTKPFQCSLFPSKGDFFLTLSKKLRDGLGVKPGDPITVELSKDESPYGTPMPDEFAEVLRQGAEADRLFHQLSAGNQKLMLKLVAYAKDVDKRIARSLVGVELLKKSGGFDWRAQDLAMRDASDISAGRFEDR